MVVVIGTLQGFGSSFSTVLVSIDEIAVQAVECIDCNSSFLGCVAMVGDGASMFARAQRSVETTAGA